MTFTEFESLQELPQDLTPLLKAMWYDRQGNWETSHNVAQDINTTDGAWVHAYLHRKEGDLSNAQYWYYRAGKKMSSKTLEKEWEEIAEALLKKEL